MNAIPEKIQALTQLLTDAAPAVASQGYDLEDLAHRLLQNGVDVTLPEPCRCHPYGEPPYGTEGQVDCPIHGESAPAPQPGDVAIATVRGAGETFVGVQVMLTEAAGPDDTEQWMSAVPVDGMFWHEIADVTVTSRAVVVTEADRDELLDAVVGLARHGVLSTVREWWNEKLGGGRS